MPTIALCSLSCYPAHVHERMRPGSYSFISREVITSCCPQCGMHLQSIGPEFYSQHSFQQGKSSKTPNVCPLPTSPSVCKHSALAYTFCSFLIFCFQSLLLRSLPLHKIQFLILGRNADNTFKIGNRSPLHLYLPTKGSGVLWIHHFMSMVLQSLHDHVN